MLKFSVVISVYNKADYIAATLDSVLKQTIQDFEIVILNDGSTDASEKEITSFLSDTRIRYFHEENRGAAAGRNFVIQKAKNDYIALLDADDIWFPTYLEEQSRLIKKYPNQKIFATNSEIFKNGRVINRQYSFKLESKDSVFDYFEASYLDSILHSSTTVVEKEVFNTIGFYNTTIKSGQDTDIYIRMGLEYKIVFSPNICVQYKVIKNSLFRTSKSINDKPNFKEYEVFEFTNPFLKKFLDLNRFSLCILAKMEGNKSSFLEVFKKINLKNLNRKQRLLLKLNKRFLVFLLYIKEKLPGLGIRLNAFK